MRRPAAKTTQVDLDPLFREALEAATHDGDPTAERILEGALALLEDFGLRRTTVEDVARRVRMSRVTIYRRFAGKDALVRAVLLRELRRFFAAIDERVAGIDATEDRLVEGFAFALQFLHDHTLLNRFLRTEPDLLLPYLTVDAGPVLDAARQFLAERLEQEIDEGRLAPLDVQVAGELLARLVLSFFLTSHSVVPLAKPDEARRFARVYLAPALRATSVDA
ncbi:TetR/AcrR family transcriptional regulator [Thermoleophilia bacterium SCSIO 60948]|nr:TetR/AcrR family transcriptional regulator [Thermoleophilia bacterium SCSIO 60948]